MVQEKKFRYIIDQETELRLLEEEHTETLFALTDENRDYLREWLVWVDNIESVSDTRRYIRSAVQQFNDDRGFQAGIWFRGNLAGIILGGITKGGMEFFDDIEAHHCSAFTVMVQQAGSLLRPGEQGMIGHLVGNGIPMARRRFRIRSVRPDFRGNPPEISQVDHVRGIGRPGQRVGRHCC